MEKGSKRVPSKLRDAFIATRPWSFIMSLISVSVATLLAAQDGPIAWGWFCLVCIGIVCFHAMANVFNDYFDTYYHVDQPDSPTAQYRQQPILSGMFTPRQLLMEGVLLSAATIAIGLTLSVARSMIVFWIGLIGFASSLFYTAGPIKYKYLAWGEVSVFLMWGPLMFEGAYAVQRHAISGKALIVSIPFGLLVSLVLLANNIRDIAYDSRQGIKTIGIALGGRRSIFLYAAIIIISYMCIIGMVLGGILSAWGFIVLLSLPMAVMLIRTFARHVPEAADAETAQLNTLFGMLLIVALILERIVPV
jgi:1,4-dihydroxy-2-naphthoate octaprenyltransferase